MAAANDNQPQDGVVSSSLVAMLLLVGECAYEIALCAEDELVLFEAPKDQPPQDAVLLTLWGNQQIRMRLHLVEGLSSASHVVRFARPAGA